MIMDTGKQAGTQWTGVPAGNAAWMNGAPSAGGVQDGKAMMAELIALLKEGVASGDGDAGVPEAAEKMIGSGADTTAVMDALRQAMEAGQISPLLYAKAEKLLAAPGGEEATDRSRILRNNRNQLTQ